MSLPRRSQSALEYMMTYGWAILVIVIVAAVLYSLGIFSPSSAISSTVTGFSNLGSVTAQCIGNQGLTIQLGNSVGYTIQITNISVSASGKTVNMPEQSNIAPSGTKVFYISNVCPSPSSRYSLSVTVYYTEPGQIFPGPYTSTGTITGSSSKQQISSTPAFDQVIPLTITNSQDNSTPNPYQQMVIVPSSVYGGYAASNFQNVEFFYSNGSIVPSWLQNYTSTNATWWLKLSSISASSSKTVYMGFVPKSTNLFNTVNDGEAPQLTCPNPSETNITSSNCPNYGVYDDGARVFLYYNNFSTSYDASYYNSPPDAPPNETLSIDDSLHVFVKNISNPDVFMATPVVTSYYSFTTYITSSGIAQNITTNGVSYDWTTVGCGAGQYNQVNLPFGRPTEAYFKNYFIGIVKSVFSNCGNSYIIFQAVPGTYGYVNIAYLFANTYPPNDKMPSVSFGYPSNITKPANIQSYAPLTISNNQNVSVSNFQQMVNVPSSVFTGYANTASGTAFQNIEFFYANGTVIPSWLENYTSSNALYWIKLPSVLAETSFTVYLGFASTSTNLFNTVNDGEAPQLSSTYAEYDDGANVFNFYMNAGSIPNIQDPNSITSYQGGAVGSSLQLSIVSNPTLGKAINITPTSANVDTYYFLNAPNIPNAFILTSWFYSIGETYDEFIGAVNSTTLNGYSAMPGDFDGTRLSLYQDSARTVLTGTPYSLPYTEWVSEGLQNNGDGNLEAYSKVGIDLEVGGTTVSVSNTQYQNFNMVFFAPWVGGSSYQRLIGLIVMRAYPPNGVMPSVSFGSVS